jgi:hypothetical protein
VAHSAFIGFAAAILALLGLQRLNRRTAAPVVIGLIGLLFALGTTINVGGREITSPLFYFYEYVPLAGFLRVYLRSFTLTLLAVSILAGIGWTRIARKLGGWNRKLPTAGLVLAFLFVAAENISWPLNPYETMEYPDIPKGYTEFFRDKPDALILDLPSHSTSWPGLLDEITYVLWQTKHERNILGGVSGYFPATRIEVQRYTDLLPSGAAFRYFQSLGVTHFVWHKSPILVCRKPHSFVGCDPSTRNRSLLEAEGYPWLETSEYLNLVFENNLLKIYELRPPAPDQTGPPADGKSIFLTRR